LNAAAGQEQWGLAELAGAPRDRAKGDVLGGEQARSRSAKLADSVVPVRLFECVIGTSGKGRRVVFLGIRKIPVVERKWPI